MGFFCTKYIYITFFLSKIVALSHFSKCFRLSYHIFPILCRMEPSACERTKDSVKNLML